jgi:hypothetical protein
MTVTARNDDSPLRAMVSQSDRYPLTPALSPKGARGKGADLHEFQNLSSLDNSGRRNSNIQPGQSPLPLGEG